MMRPPKVDITIYNALHRKGFWFIRLFPPPSIYDSHRCLGYKETRAQAIAYAKQIAPIFSAPTIWVSKLGEKGPGRTRRSLSEWKKAAKEQP